MAYHALLPLIAALASLALAILVRRNGPRTEATRAFVYLAVALIFWNLNFFVLYSVSDAELAEYLARVFRTGAYLLPAAILHMCLALSASGRRLWRAVLAADYCFAFAFAGLNALGAFGLKLQPYAWGYYTGSSSGYHLYLYTAFAVANFVLALGLILRGYRRAAEPRTRLQFKFWLLGAVVALPLGLTNLLPAYEVYVYPLGNLGSAVWAAIVAYAIVRHRLMDIDIVVTKGVAYLAVSALVILPAFGLALWSQKVSFGSVHPNFSLLLFALLLAVGVLFPTLRLRVEARVARSLFREKHEYRAALRAFTRSIVRILDRERLVRELAQTLQETMQLDRVAVVLLDSARHRFAVTHCAGPEPELPELPEDHALIRALARHQDVLLRDELELSGDPEERALARGVLPANGWEVCVPLAAGNKVSGFLGLGRKRNLDAFFVEDFELLSTLAAEASVALENARLYEELRRSHDIIRRADRLSALGTLAAGIAHEIRNPLVSIQTFFQLAPQRLDDHEFLTEFLRLTSGEVKRITDLITELLSFAKSPTPSMASVDLNELIDGVARLIDPQVRKGQISVRKELAPDLPRVRADRDQLRQVFLNLLLNAVQAIERNGEIRIVTRRVAQGPREQCQVEIADTGRGIPEELLDDIFNPFFTTKQQGVGLGLAIAHQIVTEHGGFITVQSQVGRGTAFTIHLPAEETASAQREPAARRAVGGRLRHW